MCEHSGIMLVNFRSMYVAYNNRSKNKDIFLHEIENKKSLRFEKFQEEFRQSYLLFNNK